MRSKNGKFKKGVSGNPKGRPSVSKQVAKLADKIADTVGVDYDSKDSQSFLEKSLAYYNEKFDQAKTVEDQEKFIKIGADVANKLLAYQKPRISSIESEDSRVKEISVSWGEPEKAEESHPMLAAKKEFNPEDEE